MMVSLFSENGYDLANLIGLKCEGQNGRLHLEVVQELFDDANEEFDLVELFMTNAEEGERVLNEMLWNVPQFAREISLVYTDLQLWNEVTEDDIARYGAMMPIAAAKVLEVSLTLCRRLVRREQDAQSE